MSAYDCFVNVNVAIELLYPDTTWFEKAILAPTADRAANRSETFHFNTKSNTTPGCKCDNDVVTPITLVTKTMEVVGFKYANDGTILPPDLERSLATLVNAQWEKLLIGAMLMGTTNLTTYGGQQQKNKPLISVNDVA